MAIRPGGQTAVASAAIGATIGTPPGEPRSGVNERLTPDRGDNHLGRHAAIVIAEQLADAMDRWWDDFTGDDRDAAARLRTVLHDIGARALGMTRQAAQQRYGPPSPLELTAAGLEDWVS